MDGIFAELFSFMRIGLCFLAGAVAFILAFLIRAIQGNGAREAAKNGGEAALSAFAGSILAQVTVAIFLSLGGETPGAIYVTGLFFLIWPGLIDLVASPFRPGDPLIGAEGLLWFAYAVGAGAGFFDGFRRTHDWSGLGVPRFLGDMTWGLPLTVHALALHIIDTIFGTVSSDARQGATRYSGGFRIKGNFAFTQGNVLSNLSRGPGDTLYAHEQVHVFQNRVFGPLFWMTYFGWLILFGFFGLVAWAIFRNATNASGTPVASSFPMWWGYFNNPWELWAYGKNPDGRLWNLPNQQPSAALNWPAALKVLLVAAGMAVLCGLWLLTFISTYIT
jgi:hypothetical protein